MTQILLTIVRLQCFILTMISKSAGKNATSLPGLVVEKYFPYLIQPMTQGLKSVTLITGTNGKTTTRALLVHLLQSNNQEVVTNIGGANIMRGIATALLNNLDWKNRPKIKTVVLEVEEATLPILTKFMKVDKLVLTNIFRDQLDAYGSIDQTLKYFTRSIEQLRLFNPNLRVIINGDDGKLMQCLPHTLETEQIILFGTEDRKGQLKYETDSQTNQLDFTARNIEETYKGVAFELVNNRKVVGHAQSSLPGLFNVYNILAAIACLSAEHYPTLLKNLANFKPAFGRGEIIKIGKSEVILYLVKNPAGFDEVLRLLPDFALRNKEHKQSAFLLINDNIADGRDVSWLWDTDFESHLKNLKGLEFITGGQRGLDMLLRLETAGQDVTLQNYKPDMDELIEKMEMQEGRYFVCCTYTALLQIRGLLEQKTKIGSISQKGN